MLLQCTNSDASKILHNVNVKVIIKVKTEIFLIKQVQKWNGFRERPHTEKWIPVLALKIQIYIWFVWGSHDISISTVGQNNNWLWIMASFYNENNISVCRSTITLNLKSFISCSTEVKNDGTFNTSHRT